MQKQLFIGIQEVQEITGYKLTKASLIIKEINNELKKEGCITFRGRAPRHLVMRKLGLQDA